RCFFQGKHPITGLHPNNPPYISHLSGGPAVSLKHSRQHGTVPVGFQFQRLSLLCFFTKGPLPKKCQRVGRQRPRYHGFIYFPWEYKRSDPPPTRGTPAGSWL